MDYNFLWVPKTTYHRSAQSQFVVDVFPKILKNFDLIIEIGTFTGAFTLWLSENKSDTCKIISYDITPDYCEVSDLKDTELRIGDCFDIEIMKEIRDMIQSSGRTLFLCDGGDKELEFRLYSKYLKKNDVIMLHDYSHSEHEYNMIKQRINWPTNSESHYKNIERYLGELGLSTFMYEDFKQVLWGSFIKN